MRNGIYINFIGNYALGIVGEVADELHLSRELENLGHNVNRIPRDIWKAHCDGLKNPNWDFCLRDYQQADVAIVCKWHHFDDEKYIYKMKEHMPVIYWTWDYMEWPRPWNNHDKVARASTLHLTNDRYSIPEYSGVNALYFPMDVADGNLPVFTSPEKKYDVVFFGSHTEQGARIPWLKEINKHCNLTIFSWNHQEWTKEGFKALPAVYGIEFNRVVSQAKICLQFSTNDHIWGYWSNRVGKILTAGGFLLARYAPGMELFLRGGADYFSSPEEAVEKIKFYLKNVPSRIEIQKVGRQIGRDKFTSEARVKELEIIIDRLLKGAI